MAATPQATPGPPRKTGIWPRPSYARRAGGQARAKTELASLGDDDGHQILASLSDCEDVTTVTARIVALVDELEAPSSGLSGGGFDGRFAVVLGRPRDSGVSIRCRRPRHGRIRVL